MESRLRRARIALVLVAGAIASCGGAARTAPAVRYGGPIQSRDVERGHQRYVAICAPCHADHNDRRAPMLASVHLPAWAIREQVREGDAQMTAIPTRRLSEGDLDALLAFFVATGTCVPEGAFTRSPDHDASEVEYATRASEP